MPDTRKRDTPTLASGYWETLATTDLEGVDPEQVVTLLPVGATEQHGPHLPLGTDTAIGRGIIALALDHMGDDVVLLVLPELAYGASAEHTAFPGTLSSTPETLIALWTDVGLGVARAGIRKLIIFNSHGGQPQLVDIVAQRLRATARMLVARASYYRFGVPGDLIPEQEIRGGLHGGQLETALMLALHPEQVRRDRLRAFDSPVGRMQRDFEVLAPEGPVGFAWSAQDLNPLGVCGNAGAATSETGQRVLEHASRRLVALVQDMARFRLEGLR